MSASHPFSVEPPSDVRACAIARDEARARRDFGRADELRAELLAMGWLVADSADGPVLTQAPRFPVYESATADASPLGLGARVLITVLVHGWREDADSCVQALLQYESIAHHILLVDVADRDGVGDWAEDLARSNPTRITALHLPAAADHWSRLHQEIIKRCVSDYYCVIDPSTQLTGPAITRLCETLDSRPDVVAAGWRGADVNLADNWRSVASVEGDVDVLLSYLMVIRTSVVREVAPDSKAKFYRNADIEWCLAIRDWHLKAHAVPARMMAIGDVLPATQARHHGYHDSDPDMRDRESRKTYDRILQRYRGRIDILKPR